MDNVVLDTSAWFTLAESEPGADEVDRQLLSLVPSPDRKSLLDNLSLLAAEMDKIEEKQPLVPIRKIKARKRA